MSRNAFTPLVDFNIEYYLSAKKLDTLQDIEKTIW